MQRRPVPIHPEPVVRRRDDHAHRRGLLFTEPLPKVVILVAVGAIQVYRAIQEERLLEEHIPEYAAYKLQTKRFVPGLF